MLKLTILEDLNNGGKSSVITKSDDIMSNCNELKSYSITESNNTMSNCNYVKSYAITKSYD